MRMATRGSLRNSCQVGGEDEHFLRIVKNRCDCFCRSVQANHILISSSGQVCLTGLRYCCSMVVNGVIRQKVHDFPGNFVKSLQWASPELLEQVSTGGYSGSS